MSLAWLEKALTGHALSTPGKPAKLARWSTASFGDEPDTSPMDLARLEDHLTRCKAGNRHVLGLRCTMQSVDRFLASRIVTSLLFMALLVAVLCLAL